MVVHRCQVFLNDLGSTTLLTEERGFEGTWLYASNYILDLLTANPRATWLPRCQDDLHALVRTVFHAAHPHICNAFASCRDPRLLRAFWALVFDHPAWVEVVLLADTAVSKADYIRLGDLLAARLPW